MATKANCDFSPLPQKNRKRRLAIKKTPNRSLPSSASPGKVIFVQFGPFFIFLTMGRNIVFELQDGEPQKQKNVEVSDFTYLRRFQTQQK